MTEIYKILIIENDAEQASFLKENLPKNVEVTVVSTNSEFQNVGNDDWDFIITNLYLAARQSWEIGPGNGYSIFKTIIERHVTGEIKGGGLISSEYEHHKNDNKEQMEKCSFYHGNNLKRIITEITTASKFFFRSSRRKNALNIDVRLYPADEEKKWIIDGKIEIKSWQENFAMLMEGGTKRLKPYKEMIENLIKNQ